MFSIITPTFNRAHTLERVYDSLKRQTFRNFHWVIIDDASTDNTKQMIKKWVEKETDFKIEYHLLEKNNGKPNALNFGFQFCVEPITVIADSDDSFVPETLCDLKKIWQHIDSTEHSNRICSVWTLVKDEEGKIVGDEFPKNFWQVNIEERVLNLKKPIGGEKWHSWRSNVISNYKMYHNENVNYIGESATWHRINMDYDFLCINMVHRIYWHSEDGLMQQKKSNLKTAKVKYYTSFFQLRDAELSRIMVKRHYRQLSFDYIKSLFWYRDRKNTLGLLKMGACLVNFVLFLPQRLIGKL